MLRAYFALLYVATFLTMSMFWRFANADSMALRLYVVSASAAYAALYTLAPLLMTTVVGWAVRLEKNDRGWRRFLVYLIAYLGGVLVLLSLYADYRLYELYEFHFNDFVWNLITTPGGIAALGATESTMQTVALQVAFFFFTAALALWLLHRHLQSRRLVSRRVLLVVYGVLMITLLTEEVVYAYSTYTGQEDYVQATEVVPFHLHTGATTLFKRLGIQRTTSSSVRIATGEADYPSRNLRSRPLPSYPNVIMLVGESFRWDLLDPKITPNLWKFSSESLRFERHYSGGNRTRMGLFSMFYGIYSPYWYSFERQRIAPALMEFMRSKDYQMILHTSQSFDYPELRHTLFTGVPEQFMQELQTGEPWQRDHQNISDIIAKLERRDRQRPTFAFMFFESTHAPYTFPEEDVVRTDYQRDLNYIRMNLQQNIGAIHARYVNAAHHVDREVGRLLDYLDKNGMRGNTIVLFTGDHGEEFMEKGHWGHGHNQSFPEEQIRVPLVLHLPGRKAEVIGRRTSHLQIAPTLLEALGVEQEAHTYSSAVSLFESLPYFVAGDYNYMTIFDEHHKITFPFTGRDYFHYTVHDAADHPLTQGSRKSVVESYRSRIDEVVSESRRFVRQEKGG